MLVVRSQDRNTLIVDNAIYCVEENKIYLEKIVGSYSELLAEYSTKEKALKVLDEMEATLGFANKGVFQFPQDEEVK